MVLQEDDDDNDDEKWTILKGAMPAPNENTQCFFNKTVCHYKNNFFEFECIVRFSKCYKYSSYLSSKLQVPLNSNYE